MSCGTVPLLLCVQCAIHFIFLVFNMFLLIFWTFILELFFKFISCQFSIFASVLETSDAEVASICYLHNGQDFEWYILVI